MALTFIISSTASKLDGCCTGSHMEPTGRILVCHATDFWGWDPTSSFYLLWDWPHLPPCPNYSSNSHGTLKRYWPAPPQHSTWALPKGFPLCSYNNSVPQPIWKTSGKKKSSLHAFLRSKWVCNAVLVLLCGFWRGRKGVTVFQLTWMWVLLEQAKCVRNAERSPWGIWGMVREQNEK